MPTHQNPVELISPNNVLANAMLRTVDMIRPRIEAARPDRVALCVGTQINGAPHLGTALVQTAAFLLAKAVKRTFNVDAISSTRPSPSSPVPHRRRASSPRWCSPTPARSSRNP